MCSRCRPAPWRRRSRAPAAARPGCSRTRGAECAGSGRGCARRDGRAARPAPGRWRRAGRRPPRSAPAAPPRSRRPASARRRRSAPPARGRCRRSCRSSARARRRRCCRPSRRWCSGCGWRGRARRSAGGPLPPPAAGRAPPRAAPWPAGGRGPAPGCGPCASRCPAPPPGCRPAPPGWCRPPCPAAAPRSGGRRPPPPRRRRRRPGRPPRSGPAGSWRRRWRTGRGCRRRSGPRRAPPCGAARPTPAPPPSTARVVVACRQPGILRRGMAASVERRLVADRYALGAALGRGGMGVVWRAEDVLLGRAVAVKEVALPDGPPGAERAAVRDRALREARAAARLNHPSAVTLHDVVEADGRLFLVMELVEAPSLRDLVGTAGPLPPAAAARVGLDLLDALEAAHRAGIVHHDVKPGNVMVPPDGRAKLADFGIASLQEDTQRTRTGSAFGSLPYVAPEQARGRRGGPPADLWALGATMWFAVEGAAPFDRDGPAATLGAILHDPPGRPGRAGPLGPVLLALLAKDPE